MSINYTPGALPSNPELRTEFDKIRAALQRSWPDATLDVRHAEPQRIQAGMVVYADGSDWNPGFGEGVYRRNKSNTAWAALGAPMSFRNRLRNGSFTVNQRNVSGTVTLAAGAYGHDGWKAGSGGCTYTFATSGNSTVITISAGTLLQIVEAPLIEGGTYALSNQGTAQARIAVNGAATSGSYAAATTASPLLSASATANQQVAVEFTTGTLDRVQLEPGTVGTTFERRPPSVELAICQRHYEVGYAHNYTYQTAGNIVSAVCAVKVPKRAIPTVTQSVAAPESNFTYTTTIVDAGGNAVAYGTATASGAVEIQRNIFFSSEL